MSTIENINTIKSQIRDLVNSNKKMGLEFERTAVILFGPSRYGTDQMNKAIESIDQMNKKQFDNNSKIKSLCESLLNLYGKSQVVDLKH